MTDAGIAWTAADAGAADVRVPVRTARRASTLRRRMLFGLDFVDDTDVRNVAADIMAPGGVQRGRLPVVITPNVDYLVRLGGASPTVQRVVDRAQWCLPDGQPIVWASRLLGRPLATRLAGSTLVEALWAEPSFKAQRIAVIASGDSIADRITTSHPRAEVVVAPMLPAGEPEAITEFVEQHLDTLIGARPKLVFVAIGFPKEQLAIDALLERWPDDVDLPVFLAVGASFEMLFGLRTRAPGWMQRAGLEWLFRFAQEPRRLFVRYFVRDVAFVGLVAREWRRRAAPRSGPRLVATGSGATETLSGA